MKMEKRKHNYYTQVKHLHSTIPIIRENVCGGKIN